MERVRRRNAGKRFFGLLFLSGKERMSPVCIAYRFADRRGRSVSPPDEIRPRQPSKASSRSALAMRDFGDFPC